MGADGLLNFDLLGAFAEQLTERAPEVAARLRPGLSEDEVLTRFTSVGIIASRDAVTWWRFWDGPPAPDWTGLSRQETLAALTGEHSEVLPGFQLLPLESSVRGVEANRHMASEILSVMPSEGFDLEDVWPQTWIPMFVDGGGFQFALDCQHPDRPSALRMCFREDFSGPAWGQLVCASIAAWIRNGFEWMRQGGCRYDAQGRYWVPRSGFDDVWPRFEPR